MMPKPKKYLLRYMPLFEEDVASVKNYISEKLQNPSAALALISALEKAILQRLSAPLAFEAYPSIRQRKHNYYRIYVKNYTVFYVVIDNVMEIRRFLYSSRDMDKLL